VARPAQQNTPPARRRFGSILWLLVLLALCVALIANEWAQQGKLSRTSQVYLGLVFLLLVSVPLLPWIIGPVLIYQTYRIKTERAFDRFDPQAADTSPHVAEPIRETAAALVPLGFTPGTHVWSTNDAPRATTFLSLFESPWERTRALLITIYAGRGKRVRRQTVLAFSTELADGSEVATNNATMLSNTPRWPARTTVNLPDVRDSAELFKIHAAVLEHLGAPVERRLPVDGDPVARQQDYTRREEQRFVEAGYLDPDPEGEYYRATWKGAVLMAWKLLWPVSAIRRARLRRRSQALLRACGLGGETARGREG
jgi:hypothetical protein